MCLPNQATQSQWDNSLGAQKPSTEAEAKGGEACLQVIGRRDRGRFPAGQHGCGGVEVGASMTIDNAWSQDRSMSNGGAWGGRSTERPAAADVGRPRTERPNKQAMERIAAEDALPRIIFPRRKSGEKEQKARPLRVSREMLESLFELPLPDACKSLGCAPRATPRPCVHCATPLCHRPVW